MNEETIKQILIDNSELLSEIFKKPEQLIVSAVQASSGTKQEIFHSILVSLNLPLNKETIILLNSILKESTEKSFFEKFFDLFN